MNYIFDYGATIDTPGNHWGKTIWHAYERAGVPICEDTFREAYVFAERYLGSHAVISPTDTFHTTLSQKLRLQLEHLGYFSEEHRDNFSEEHRDNISESEGNPFESAQLHQQLLDDLYSMTVRNISESRKVIKTLHEQGHVLGVVSNFYGNIEAVLEEFNLRQFFTAVVESATEGIRKPDPRLLALCMERMKAKPKETIVIGDHLTKDISPAKQLCCTAIWIKGEPWSDEHDKLSEVAPDRIISSLNELLD